MCVFSIIMAVIFIQRGEYTSYDGIVIDNHYSHRHKKPMFYEQNHFYCKVQYNGNKTCEQYVVANSMNDDKWENRIDDVITNNILDNYANGYCKINSTLSVYEQTESGDCEFDKPISETMIGILFAIVAVLQFVLFISMVYCKKPETPQQTLPNIAPHNQHEVL
jgi:hypothetical protein